MVEKDFDAYKELKGALIGLEKSKGALDLFGNLGEATSGLAQYVNELGEPDVAGELANHPYQKYLPFAEAMGRDSSRKLEELVKDEGTLGGILNSVSGDTLKRSLFAYDPKVDDVSKDYKEFAKLHEKTKRSTQILSKFRGESLTKADEEKLISEMQKDVVEIYRERYKDKPEWMLAFLNFYGASVDKEGNVKLNPELASKEVLVRSYMRMADDANKEFEEALKKIDVKDYINNSLSEDFETRAGFYQILVGLEEKARAEKEKNKA